MTLNKHQSSVNIVYVTKWIQNRVRCALLFVIQKKRFRKTEIYWIFTDFSVSRCRILPDLPIFIETQSHIESTANISLGQSTWPCLFEKLPRFKERNTKINFVQPHFTKYHFTQSYFNKPQRTTRLHVTMPPQKSSFSESSQSRLHHFPRNVHHLRCKTQLHHVFNKVWLPAVARWLSRSFQLKFSHNRRANRFNHESFEMELGRNYACFE